MRDKFYIGSTFIESLLAIMIIGIAGITLISIGTKTINREIQNERADVLRQEITNAVMEVRIIANRYNNDSSSTEFPTDDGACFVIDSSVDPSFKQNGSGFISVPEPSNGDFSDNSNFARNFLVGGVSTPGYLAYCNESKSVDGRTIYGTVFVGFANCHAGHGVVCKYNQGFVIKLTH